MPSRKKVMAKDAIKNLDKTVKYKSTALNGSISEVHSSISESCEMVESLYNILNEINQKLYGMQELSDSIGDSISRKESMENVIDITGSKLSVDENVDTCVTSMSELMDSSKKNKPPIKSVDDCDIVELKEIVKCLITKNDKLEKEVKSLKDTVNKISMAVSTKDDTSSSHLDPNAYMNKADYD